MKYLKKFEDFKTQMYAVGDLVKLSNNEIAKIMKISSKNAYIVNIMKNHIFIKTPISVRDNNDGSIFIVKLVQSGNNPAIGSDLFQRVKNDPSNDFVINGGYPDTPLANVMGY